MGVIGRSDESLLRRSATDPGAFACLYRRHERSVVGFVGRLVRDADLTVDLVAETFARAYVSRDAFDPARGSARSWLFGIASNVLAESRRRGVVDDEARRRLGMDPIHLGEASIRSVEDAVLQSDEAIVDGWLAGLADEQREAVRRRVLEDAPYTEIAQELRCSEAVVRQRVSRGLSRLREQLLEER